MSMIPCPAWSVFFHADWALLLQLGVELDDKGGVKVDDYSQSNVPSIWAIGDVSNRIPLTPVARMEGTYFAQHLFGYVTPVTFSLDGKAHMQKCLSDHVCALHAMPCHALL